MSTTLPARAAAPAPRTTTDELELTVAMLDTVIARIEHRSDRGCPNLYAAVLRALHQERDGLQGRLDTLHWQDVDERRSA